MVGNDQRRRLEAAALSAVVRVYGVQLVDLCAGLRPWAWGDKAGGYQSTAEAGGGSAVIFDKDVRCADTNTSLCEVSFLRRCRVRGQLEAAEARGGSAVGGAEW